MEERETEMTKEEHQEFLAHQAFLAWCRSVIMEERKSISPYDLLERAFQAGRESIG